ncbi:hypothetical protein BH24ACI4_BH24ACI4_33740 [soil metagenome]
MTGTARDCAGELRDTYGLDVVVVPTNRPMLRADRPDVVFATREAKERAVVDEIRRVSRMGRPVLVGTLTVEESERLSERLRGCGVSCHVLNAKNPAAEAAIVANAGAPGAVTISTNMAGRGTDIRLGGDHQQDRERVAALGGLYVIGTNRHESQRIDLQLRGRAGRQGDPGESQLFVSLEDDLLVRYGIRGLLPPWLVTPVGDEPIENPVVRREIARAQRIIEGQNFDIRRTLSQYSAIVEEQHRVLLEWREALLLGRHTPDVWRRLPERFRPLVESLGEEAVLRGERTVTLHHIDRAWCDHLVLCADLREGSHLARLGGQNPLQRFAQEAALGFSRIHDEIDDAVLASLDHVQVTSGELDLAGVGMKAPASTWTYMVNDDPFRHQIGALLTGPGGATIAIYSAAILMPLLMLWGLVDTFLRKRPGRRPSPFGPPD